MFKRFVLFSAWPLLAAVLCAGVITNGFSFARSRAPQPEAQSFASTAKHDAVLVDRSSDNPVVEPGKVRWHASFADAQAAAQRSGKPVLLFHMMGELDRQFC